MVNAQGLRAKHSIEHYIKRSSEKDLYCGGLTKNGEFCIKGRGWRTDQPGEGRCLFHDGLASGSPIEAFEIPALKERVEQLKEQGAQIDVDGLTAVVNSLTRNIANLVKTKHEIEVGRKYVIDVRVMNVIISAIGSVIDRTVPDIEARAAINSELSKALLPMGNGT